MIVDKSVSVKSFSSTIKWYHPNYDWDFGDTNTSITEISRYTPLS